MTARRGSVRSWVLGVVHNRTIDAFRRETVRAGKDVADDGGPGAHRRPASAPTPRSCAATRPSTVREALGELPADQRQVIELAYFGGFSHSQIADMLKLPAGTVKGRMRLGLSKLRLALGDPAGATL